MNGNDSRRALAELSDDELRDEARRRGLHLGRALSREQLLALLSEEDGEEASVDDPEEGEEPLVFPTVAMARLHADQGHPEEAARLCRAVLSRRPDESRARTLLARLAGAGIEPIRARTGARGTPRSGPQGTAPPPAAAELEARLRGEVLLLVPVAPTRLHAAFRCDAAVLERARRHAGEGAELVLRLFSAWRGPKGVVRRTADSPSPPAGARFLEKCAPAAVHRGALGWLTGAGRFVPAVHSDVAETPPGRACAVGRPVTVGVRPSAGAGRSPGAAERLLSRLLAGVVMALPWEADAASWPEPDCSPEPPCLPLEGPPASRSSPAGGAAPPPG